MPHRRKKSSNINIKHIIEFDKTKVIAKILSAYNRMVREFIEIRKTALTVNRGDDLGISGIWLPIGHKVNDSNDTQNHCTQSNWMANKVSNRNRVLENELQAFNNGQNR